MSFSAVFNRTQYFCIHADAIYVAAIIKEYACSTFEIAISSEF